MPARSRTHSNRQTAAPTASVQPVASTGPAAGRAFPWPLAIGFAALAVGLVALGWTLVASGDGGSDCQARAWDSIPEERALPEGWAVTATNFFVGNATVTLEGPAADTDTGEGVVYATVTCYGNDASEALARSRAADASTGSPTTDLEDIGNDGYAIEDGSGLSALHFRRGDLVSYLVVAGNVTPEELRSTASSFDQAMIDAKAGDLPSIAPAATPGPVDATLPIEPPAVPSEAPLGSQLPNASPASPELEGMLPTEIGGTPFIVQSFTGTDAFGNDAGSRAVTAGLRALGKSPADLELAEAYDQNESLDLYLFAFRLPGADPEALRTLVLDSWLVADAEGVTSEEVQLGGKTVTHVDYGDDFQDAYVYSLGDTAVIIQSGTPELAAAAAEALPTE
jgi:hypothetical protein